MLVLLFFLHIFSEIRSLFEASEPAPIVIKRQRVQDFTLTVTEGCAEVEI